MGVLNELFQDFISVMRTFQFKDAVDIIAIAIIIYSLIKLVRETRAVQLVKGILILMLLYAAAFVFKLTLLTAMLNKFFEFAVLLLFIVFQPEIRKILEQLGRSNFSYRKIKGVFTDSGSDDAALKKKKNISIYVDAVMQLHSKKTGALIVFERRTRLGDIAYTGTTIDANPSTMLIGNIFFNKAPLHDGAMIVRDGKVYAAGCILPLTKNEDVDDNLGTRHRAALGVSEESDAVVVVVSEETGSVSIALNGVLTRDYNRETLTNTLNDLLVSEESEYSDKLPFLPNSRKEKKEDE
ncbi:MAG: diadenylate cyclase CdaA [Lachnospiraceae bacterium]|nr:diadenylate cyclase CdaA [Lachnospiraceae bacterium]